jgi:hypothetical protein
MRPVLLLGLDLGQEDATPAKFLCGGWSRVDTTDTANAASSKKRWAANLVTRVATLLRGDGRELHKRRGCHHHIVRMSSCPVPAHQRNPCKGPLLARQLHPLGRCWDLNGSSGRFERQLPSLPQVGLGSKAPPSDCLPPRVGRPAVGHEGHTDSFALAAARTPWQALKRYTSSSIARLTWLESSRLAHPARARPR